MPDFNPANIHTHGVILSGGKGQRMSGKDKGLVIYNQLPLAQHVINRLKPQVNSLIVSANRNLQEYEAMNPKVVTDCLEGYGGPLVGVLSAMRFISNNSNSAFDAEQGKDSQLKQAQKPRDWIVLSPCDAPLLPTDLVIQLTTELIKLKNAVQCLVPYDGIRNQPLFAMLALSTMPTLIAAISNGERKAERWLLSLSHSIVDCSASATGFRNFNTIEDLQYRTG